MEYFTSNFAEFFKELATHNNKIWFHNHKSNYEQFVKFPFEKFITDLISEISKYEDLRSVTAKDCILRINKDIRFSRDKSPYNLHVTAFVSQGGRKDKSIPGIFLRFSPESVGIMGGCYTPSKTQVESIRKHIENNMEKFKALYSDKNFSEKFGKIQGEAIKRIPKHLKSTYPEEPLLLNKQWYFVTEREPGLLLSPNLKEEIMPYYFAAKPLNDFLTQANH